MVGCLYGLVVTFIALILASIMMLGCSPRIIEHVKVQHDTTYVARVDSVRVYEKDSVMVQVKGDTVLKYVERIRYRDRIKIDTLLKVCEIHDTTTVTKEVPAKLTKCQQSKLDTYGWLVAIIIGLLIWTFRKPLIALVKKLIPL